MDDDDLDDDWNGEGAVHMIHALQPGGHPRKRVPRCSDLLAGYKVDALIDTGASINVIATSVLQRIPFQPPLRPTTTQVYTFGSSKPLPLAGVFTTASDFPVPIDVSSGDQDYDDVMLQSSGFESKGAFIAGDVQNPGSSSMELDHGSGDQLVEESIASGSGQVGPITSTRGDGPYNLRPRPQCSTRFRDFVVN
ncbi:hypothetical protein NDU88_006007 [Pleurodeles waltl]|uniref:Peptidase A2 domain-containing protein n=1 Tax=Pleurodeles waltl TaxID=8319 RepID=A0AAV7VN16_PLEWA|nr:hypothetical protein NDU88_006007 [Pleurodeles waltl]